MRSYLLILILSVFGCASKPTPYQKEKNKEGYSDSSQNEFEVATFKANARTKKNRARLYAQFRAIVKCRERSLKTNVLAILDQSIEKEVTRSSGGGWGPTYGFGMYPYYGHSSFGFGANFSTISSDSWKEVLEYPIVEVYYKCVDRVLRPLVEFRELSSEQMRHLVLDVKGGLQIEEISPGSPNNKVFDVGDIILKANGKRIERIFDLLKLFNEGGQTVNIEFLREGRKMYALMKSFDVTVDAKKEDDKVILEVCARKLEKNEDLLRDKKLCP